MRSLSLCWLRKSRTWRVGCLSTCLSLTGKVSPVWSLAYLQSCIDWNREVLKRELGLADCDIIDIPQLFKTEKRKAVAFFPDLVSSPSSTWASSDEALSLTPEGSH